LFMFARDAYHVVLPVLLAVQIFSAGVSAAERSELEISQVSRSGQSERIVMKAGSQHLLSFDESIVRTSVPHEEIMQTVIINDRSLMLTGISPGQIELNIWLGDLNTPHRVIVDVMPDIVLEGDDTQVSLSSDGATLSGPLNRLDARVSGETSGVTDNRWQEGVQVQTDIRIVEVNKRQLEASGFFIGRTGAGQSNYAAGRTDNILSFLSGSAVVPNAAPGGFSIARISTSGVLAAVSALRTNGFASVLAEPSVVSISGQSSAFLAGGEFPVPVRSRDNEVTVEYKEFGIRVQITPTVLDSNRIVLKVAPEVSELNYTNAVQTGGVSVPSLSVRRTDTTVQLGDGESFIISGLMSNDVDQSTDRVPLLGDLPVLGALFRGTRYEREERELVMIVTPHLIEPIASDVQIGDLPGHELRRYVPALLETMFNPKDAAYIERNTRVGFSR